ncbi:MAG: SusD/RagB family nutrient-binding outer membrane lipoprotein [Tannerella sp.]|nr:SusD/RagB family nutrient-binding outer membrane lipoprotein [Tannerella sp.]
MKKLISIMIVLACVFTFSRCSEDAYSDKYVDPNKVTSLLMDKLMVGVFDKCNDWAIMGYGRYYSFDNLYLANFTQSFGRPYSPTMYHNGWSDDGSGKYGSLFSATGILRKMEMMYDEMAEAEKPSYEAYLLAARVHVYAFLLSMLDTYGDLPFREGGIVAATGILDNSNAHFDKAEDLYLMILDELKTIGQRFATVSKPKDFTATQDFVNEADFGKWQKYANSTRLRAAMRVASQGVLADAGRAAVREILENPTLYPIVENFDDNIVLFSRVGGKNEENGGRGLDDGDGSSNRASDDLLSRMLSDYDRATWSGSYQDGIDDPRVPILYDLAVKEPNKQTGYPSYVDEEGRTVTQSGRAVPTVFRGATYEMPEAVMESYTTNAKGISLLRYNGLFYRNVNFDHQIYTSPETWFIKAEAYLNGWAAGDAKAAFKEGVIQSIRFYVHYHATKANADEKPGIDGNTRRGWVINPNLEAIDDAWLDAFAEARWEAPINGQHPYENKLDAIITQKYINFSIFYVREAWNDLRRTGYPSGIYFPRVSDATVPELPVRLRYPTGERDFNKNFSEVNRPGFNADDYYTKLFWAK